MKKKIHPDYGSSTIICACGNKVETGSTVTELKVEICSACHPFYTGQKKIVDSAGRVDRFKKRMEKSQSIIAEEETKQELKKKKKKKKKKAE